MGRVVEHLRVTNEARNTRRNVGVKAPRLISMCRQAILKKAPLYLYLANRRPTSPPPSRASHRVKPHAPEVAPRTSSNLGMTDIE